MQQTNRCTPLSSALGQRLQTWYVVAIQCGVGLPVSTSRTPPHCEGHSCLPSGPQRWGGRWVIPPMIPPTLPHSAHGVRYVAPPRWLPPTRLLSPAREYGGGCSCEAGMQSSKVKRTLSGADGVRVDPTVLGHARPRPLGFLIGTRWQRRSSRATFASATSARSDSTSSRAGRRDGLHARRRLDGRVGPHRPRFSIGTSARARQRRSSRATFASATSPRPDSTRSWSSRRCSRSSLPSRLLPRPPVCRVLVCVYPPCSPAPVCVMHRATQPRRARSCVLVFRASFDAAQAQDGDLVLGVDASCVRFLGRAIHEILTEYWRNIRGIRPIGILLCISVFLFVLEFVFLLYFGIWRRNPDRGKEGRIGMTHHWCGVDGDEPRSHDRGATMTPRPQLRAQNRRARLQPVFTFRRTPSK